MTSVVVRGGGGVCVIKLASISVVAILSLSLSLSALLYWSSSLAQALVRSVINAFFNLR